MLARQREKKAADAQARNEALSALRAVRPKNDAAKPSAAHMPAPAVAAPATAAASTVAPAAASLVDVKVKTLTGLEYLVGLAPDDTVAHVKAKLQEKSGVPVERQLLVYGGRALTDDEDVNDLGILQSSACIHMVCVAPRPSAMTAPAGAAGGVSALLDDETEKTGEAEETGDFTSDANGIDELDNTGTDNASEAPSASSAGADDPAGAEAADARILNKFQRRDLKGELKSNKTKSQQLELSPAQTLEKLRRLRGHYEATNKLQTYHDLSEGFHLQVKKRLEESEKHEEFAKAVAENVERVFQKGLNEAVRKIRTNNKKDFVNVMSGKETVVCDDAKQQLGLNHAIVRSLQTQNSNLRDEVHDDRFMAKVIMLNEEDRHEAAQLLLKRKAAELEFQQKKQEQRLQRKEEDARMSAEYRQQQKKLRADERQLERAQEKARTQAAVASARAAGVPAPSSAPAADAA
jgi:hypothetical protein